MNSSEIAALMPPPPSIAVIALLTAKHFGVSTTDLVSHRQSRRISVPRHVAMWLIKEMTVASYPEIGRAFGDRDHSTVMTAVARLEQRMAREAAFAADVNRLRCAIAGAVA